MTKETNITIAGSRVIRPALSRRAVTSVDYADSVRQSSPGECVFCPDALNEDLIIERVVGAKVCNWLVIYATPPYDHFDAQRVVEHRLILPDVHIEDERRLGRRALDVRDDWVASQQPSEGYHTIQAYTRAPGNPSKSQPHTHTHVFELSPDPVSSLEYDIRTGLTRLEFDHLTPEQHEILAASRTD